MHRPVHKYILKLSVTLVALLIPATPALADEPPVLHLSVLGAVHTGEPVQFSGSSSYTSTEQLYLTVSVVHAGVCPSSSAAPSGSDTVITNEAVDNFLSITDLSDNLSSGGQWSLCGYLTNAASTTIAAASVQFNVSGPHGPKGHRSGHTKHGHSKKHHKH
jgi:hypothetical protein